LVEVIVVITIVIVMFAILANVAGCQNWGGKRTISGTVKRVYEEQHGNSTRHMVAVEHASGHVTTLRNEDTLYYGKWNSSTIQNELVVGKPYFFEIYGNRNEFFSLFPNIISVKPNTEEVSR
jgi:hypothetical protein